MNLEKLSIVLCVIGVILFLSSLTLGFESVAKHYYKKGYEDAVEDFYKGKLKCERIEESNVKYIWKKEK